MNETHDLFPARGSHTTTGRDSDGRIRVFVVDDHPAIREALATTINSKLDMRLIGESGSAGKALQQMERSLPDVVIVDISLDDAHGLDLVEQIREQFPTVRVVVFSMYDESVYAERAIRAGASGYIMKSEPTQHVVKAIQSVSDGEVYLSRRMSSRILSKVIRQQDYSVRDIAGQLDLSRKTIETYRRRAKEKLGFETVAELLQYAVQWTYGRDEENSGAVSGEDA